MKAPVVGQTEPIVCLNCRAQIEPMTGAILNGDAAATAPVPDATATSLPPPKKAYPRKPVSAAGLTSAPQTQERAAPAAPVAARRVPMQAGPQPAQQQHPGVPYPAQVPPQFPGQYPPQGAPYPAQQPPLRYPPQQGVPYPVQQPPQFLAPGQARPGLPGVPFGPAAKARRGMPRWGWALVAAGALVMIGLVVLGIWAAGGGGASNTDNWIMYTSPDKSFTAKFPGEPTRQTHRLDNGVMVHETMYRSAWGHWEVSWIDMTNREAWFPLLIGELATTADAKITRQEERRWKGKIGYYAELDDGRYTVQMFIAQSRLWTVATYRQHETFSFFLDNLQLSDKAMGIDPLTISFAQEGVAFEGSDNTKWNFTIKGGRMPYKLDFSKPTPDSRYVRDRSGQAYEIHIGTSSNAKAGKHPVTASVTDADGRKVGCDGVIEVQKVLGEIGRLDVALRSGLYDVGTIGTNSIKLSLGCMLHGEAIFVPTHPQFPIVQPYFNVDDLPEWLQPDSSGVGTFSGRAEVVGVYAFKVHTKIRLQGLDKWFPMERAVTVQVVPLTAAEVPRQIGNFAIKHVTGQVDGYLEGRVEFLAPVPDEWVGMRNWEVDAKWALTQSEMTKLMPKGVSVHISQPELRDSYAKLSFSGWSREAVDRVVDFKLIVTVKYLPEPVELTASVQFKIEAFAGPERLSDPAEALVRKRAGSAINKTVVAVLMTPPDWPRSSVFSYKVEWLLDGVSVPDGLRLDTWTTGSTYGQDLLVKGSINTVGEYFVHVPIRVTLTATGKTYDLTQKIKIVIS